MSGNEWEQVERDIRAEVQVHNSRTYILLEHEGTARSLGECWKCVLCMFSTCEARLCAKINMRKTHVSTGNLGVSEHVSSQNIGVGARISEKRMKRKQDTNVCH